MSITPAVSADLFLSTFIQDHKGRSLCSKDRQQRLLIMQASKRIAKWREVISGVQGSSCKNSQIHSLNAHW